MESRVMGRKVEIEQEIIGRKPDEIRRQLEEYLSGERESFDLEVNYPDSFTGRVMQAMKEISYGETRSYGEIAEELETSAVAVGQACSRNPVPVIVPCHRVVSSDGTGGYAYGRELKCRLLELENRR